MEYDEDTELTSYVWDYFGRLMTQHEHRVGLAIFVQQKAAIGSPEVARFLDKRHSLSGDPDVQAALREGADAFRRRVRIRLLSEHADEVVVNRCPNCQRVVRTQRAMQCFWCGHDWHG